MKRLGENFYVRAGWLLLVLAIVAAAAHAIFLVAPPPWRSFPGAFPVLSVSLCLSFASLVLSYLLMRRTGRGAALAARIFSNVWMVLAMILTYLVVTGK